MQKRLRTTGLGALCYAASGKHQHDTSSPENLNKPSFYCLVLIKAS